MLDNVPLLMITLAGALVLIIGGFAIYYACRHVIGLTTELRDIRLKQDARDKHIDQWLTKIEDQIYSRDRRGPPSFRERDIDRPSFKEVAEPPERGMTSSQPSIDKERKPNMIRAPQEPAPSYGAQMPSYPEPRAEAAPSVLEAALRALESANSCNRFADEWKATGFGIDGDGSPSQEPTSSPDRGEILVLAVGGRYVVVPSFNMKRNQGLYTSDAGRAAQTRLGWLFEIERGERLLALEAAEITSDWAVIKKGRLALPLEKS